MSCIDGSLKWHLEFYVLASMPFTCLCLSPDLVAVHSYATDMEMFWPMQRKQRCKRATVQAKELTHWQAKWAKVKGDVVQDVGIGEEDEDDVDEAHEYLPIPLTSDTHEADELLHARVMSAYLEDVADPGNADAVVDPRVVLCETCGTPYTGEQCMLCSSTVVNSHLGSDAVPQPPLPDVPRPAVVRSTPLSRNQAAATVDFGPGKGKIAFYEGKSVFEGHCGNPSHGKCVLTRTSRGRKPKGHLVSVAGRPLGFMKAWIDAGLALPSKEAHWDKDMWIRDLSEQATRLAARQTVQNAEGGPLLLSKERPLDAGEADEPPSLLGLFH
eukprot:6490510-Amphidinium_carterae.1